MMILGNWTNVFGFTDPNSGGGRSFDIQKRGGQDQYCIHVYGQEWNILPLDLDWHHLAATYDRTTIKWYGDGHLAGSWDRDLNTLDNVQMGKRADNDNYFDGNLDDVRIYNRALSHEEVAYLAGKGVEFTQELWMLLTPQDPRINMYQESPDSINFKDLAEFGIDWRYVQMWPLW